MDKNIPTKVIKKEGWYSLGYTARFTLCPNCEKSLGSYTKGKNNKCPKCDQKIIW